MFRSDCPLEQNSLTFKSYASWISKFNSLKLRKYSIRAILLELIHRKNVWFGFHSISLTDGQRDKGNDKIGRIAIRKSISSSLICALWCCPGHLKKYRLKWANVCSLQPASLRMSFSLELFRFHINILCIYNKQFLLFREFILSTLLVIEFIENGFYNCGPFWWYTHIATARWPWFTNWYFIRFTEKGVWFDGQCVWRKEL